MTKAVPIEDAGPAITLLLAQAAGQPVTFIQGDRAVAYLITPEALEGWLETQEILANPEAMQAIADYEAGRLNFLPIEELEEFCEDED